MCMHSDVMSVQYAQGTLVLTIISLLLEPVHSEKIPSSFLLKSQDNIFGFHIFAVNYQWTYHSNIISLNKDYMSLGFKLNF